jgi:hypothetical protein
VSLAASLVEKGFRRAWVVDSEYRQPWGERPTPHCVVAHCVITGQTIRAWVGGETAAPCPFALDDSELFIAYAADAEIGCFLQLGWPPPPCILDLFPEFLRMRNGRPRNREHDGLIDALAHFGEASMGADEKTELRGLAIRGGPFTEVEKAELLDYCERDVDATASLLERMRRTASLDNPLTFRQALWRGRYTAAVAAIRAVGVPLDMPTLKRFDANWGRLKSALIESLGARFGVYDAEGSFRERLFRGYLEREKLLRFWPRLDSGALALDGDTFSDMSKQFPQLEPLHELRKMLGKIRLTDLEIGQDGRNRFYLAPFRTKTSRNAPSSARFIFGASKALRNLIRPPEGCALAYADWSAQELGVAAALSGDEALWAAFATGDPYLAFAKKIGRAPADATRETHGEIREAFKALTLGILYGMTVYGLARRLGVSELSAADLLRRHRNLYARFWRWAERNVDAALLGMPLTTRLGWVLQYPVRSLAEPSPRTAMNYAVQAHGAELLRYAAIRATEAGMAVCCLVHDALLVEASNNRIDSVVAELRTIMGDAAETILGAGYRIEADVSVVRWPEAYREKRGLELYNTLLKTVERIEGLSTPLEALNAS